MGWIDRACCSGGGRLRRRRVREVLSLSVDTRPMAHACIHGWGHDAHGTRSVRHAGQRQHGRRGRQRHGRRSVLHPAQRRALQLRATDGGSGRVHRHHLTGHARAGGHFSSLRQRRCLARRPAVACRGWRTCRTCRTAPRWSPRAQPAPASCRTSMWATALQLGTQAGSQPSWCTPASSTPSIRVVVSYGPVDLVG